MYLIDIDTPNKKQKFRRGQVVKIAKNLDPSMSHFVNNTLAIVKMSDAENGGEFFNLYELIIKNEDGGWHEVAWYEEKQLKEIDDIILCKKIEKSFLKYKKRSLDD